MTRRELEENIQALVDGTLGEADFAAVEAELLANAEARAFYRKSMETELLLSDLISEPLPQPMPDEIAGWPFRASFLSRFSRPLLAIAALLLALAVAGSLIMVRISSRESMVSTPVSGTQWLVNGDACSSQSVASKVTEGSTVEVLSGTLKLQLPSGVEMVMRGPAIASFPSLHAPLLQKGALWVDSDASLVPVEIKTPGLRVRDVGTRFGVRIQEDGNTEVHITEGMVEVDSAGTKKTLAVLKPTGKGVLIKQTGKTEELPMEHDPFPLLSKLLESSSNYPTTIMGQSPAGYWRLNLKQKFGRILENEINPEYNASHYLHSFPSEPAPGKADGFPGFEDSNLGMVFRHGGHATGLYAINIPGGLPRTNGGMSFWVRKPPGMKLEEVLWSASEATSRQTKLSGLAKSFIMQCQITTAGTLDLHIENGEQDVKVSSKLGVVDDKWHHVAFSWDAGSAEIFIDGISAGRKSFQRNTGGADRLHHVRLAVSSAEIDDKQVQSYAGWLDEVAIWDRKLSSEEVRSQYEAALRP